MIRICCNICYFCALSPVLDLFSFLFVCRLSQAQSLLPRDRVSPAHPFSSGVAERQQTKGGGGHGSSHAALLLLLPMLLVLILSAMSYMETRKNWDLDTNATEETNVQERRHSPALTAPMGSSARA